MLRSDEHRYGLVTKILHWAVAALILGLVWLGWWMADLDYYHAWYNRSLELHKGFGMVALALAAAKVGWVLLDGKPAYQPNLAEWERAAARVTHQAFYVLMLVMPVSGYVVSTSEGEGIDVFGWFEAPALFAVSETAREVAIALHYFLGYGFAALVAIHAAAALKHQVVDRDGTLRRMLW